MAVCSMEDGLGQCCSQDHIATHKKAWAHASQGSHVSGHMHLSVMHLSAHASQSHVSQSHASRGSCISGLTCTHNYGDPQGHHACAFCGTQRCVRPLHNFTVIAIRARETMSGHHPKGDSESRSDLLRQEVGEGC